MKKRFLIGLMTAAILLGLQLPAAALTVEQVQVVMPEIDVYVYEDGTDLSELNPEDVRAELAGEPLRITAMEPSEQGIYYVYMLDISGSIPNSHFEGAKAAILDATTRLRPQDRLSLITFGDEVKLVLQGGEDYETVKSTLAGLRARDNNTRFYNAMRALVKLVSETDDMRRIAVVVSDGVDETDAGITREELEQTLVQYGISVNALGIDVSDNTESFRSLVEITGGDLYTFNGENAGEVLGGLLDRLDQGWLIRLEADSNQATGVETPLILDIAGEKLEMTVVPERFEADTTIPKVVDVSVDAEAGTITVAYSEEMADADLASAYVLTDANRNPVELTSVTCEDGVNAVLKLEPFAAQRELHLRISGLHDNSMEQNEIYEYYELVWYHAEPTPVTPTAKPVKDPETIDTGMLKSLVIAGGIVLVGALAIILLEVKQAATKKKKTERIDRGRKKAQRSSKAQNMTFVFSDDQTKKK